MQRTNSEMSLSFDSESVQDGDDIGSFGVSCFSDSLYNRIK